jgi:predicted phage terminase large subunit-like protein
VRAVRIVSPFAALAAAIDPQPWEPADRPPLAPHQLPPPGTPGRDWALWILAGGRGAGKTEAAAVYFARYMRAHPGHRGLIIAPTSGDAHESCIAGPSGLLSIDPEIVYHGNSRGGPRLVWRNGAEAVAIGTYSPDDVERLRAAGNRHLVWLEEAAANRHLAAAWEMAELGLRLGDHPHAIASTTPRNTRAYRALLAMPGTVVTRGTMEMNPGIAEERKEALRRRYAGTRIGRQELDGELLEDVEGALWSPAMIEAAHASCPDPLPDMARVVVAIDPAVTSGEDADETGIVVVGKGIDGRAYVLADRSCRLSPDGWAKRALAAYDEFSADRIVAEVNNGGDLVERVIRTVRAGVPFRALRATRGKVLRAEPVAALYEQGRVSHAGALPALEDEMTTWTTDAGFSPDHLDALVWGVTELGLVAERARRSKARDRGRRRDDGPLTADMLGRHW